MSRIDEYQVVINGQTMTVDELTELEAKAELCNLIDVLEGIADAFSIQRGLIRQWRNGGEVTE